MPTGTGRARLTATPACEHREHKLAGPAPILRPTLVIHGADDAATFPGPPPTRNTSSPLATGGCCSTSRQMRSFAVAVLQCPPDGSRSRLPRRTLRSGAGRTRRRQAEPCPRLGATQARRRFSAARSPRACPSTVHARGVLPISRDLAPGAKTVPPLIGVPLSPASARTPNRMRRAPGTSRYKGDETLYHVFATKVSRAPASLQATAALRGLMRLAFSVGSRWSAMTAPNCTSRS